VSGPPGLADLDDLIRKMIGALLRNRAAIREQGEGRIEIRFRAGHVDVFLHSRQRLTLPDDDDSGPPPDAA
jgi:hypothetical protein